MFLSIVLALLGKNILTDIQALVEAYLNELNNHSNNGPEARSLLYIPKAQKLLDL